MDAGRRRTETTRWRPSRCAPLVREKVRNLLVVAVTVLLMTGFVGPVAAAPVGGGCTRYTDTATLCGPVRDAYERVGGASSPFGLPRSGDFAAAGGGGRGVHLERASIYWSPSTGAHVVQGVIRDRWAALGWENGLLGLPLTDESPVMGTDGRVTLFEHGSVYWSLTTGAHEVHGAIRELWLAQGGAAGPLGLPVTDESPAFGGWPQKTVASFFVGGAVYSDRESTSSHLLGDTTVGEFEEALTISNLSLDGFTDLSANRQGRQDRLDWTNDGCSGPTFGQVESTFHRGCLRHDFGSRNFGRRGLALDPSNDRFGKINATLLIDSLDLCERAGWPRINNGRGPSTACRDWATTVYEGVSKTSRVWWR